MALMKTLLTAGAIGEAALGIFVFVAPALALGLFFRIEPLAGTLIMARVAGIALVGFGVACYPRGPQQGRYGLLVYSVLIMLYLIDVGITGSAGVLLWPAVVVHALLSVFLIVAPRGQPTHTTSS